MEIAIAIELLVPAAKYFGSTTPNTRECFETLDWFDEREKPTWQQLNEAYADAGVGN